MSEMYEGVVFHGTLGSASAAFASIRSPLTLRLVRLTESVFGVYRVAGRHVAFEHADIEAVAAHLSSPASAALAVFYNNQVGFREAILYRNGRQETAFGEEDELWVPLDEKGEPLVDAERLTVSELEEDEEYQTIQSAIEAGLAALGVSATANLLKQAFCHHALEWLMERNPS